ncbi:Receptor polysaccharide phosphotransferase [Streptococcus infantarius subsp. infantarius]|nr:Receptor polysaccharide phosphotransferase [Streptococcus infantarius subsp. infantarius]
MNQEIDGEQRYRDYDVFNYWFRMIEKNAPWVNNVYLITNGQKPDWLNLEHPKLKLVTHREFMPKEYLPTYNSAAIELNLHHIEGLSENYLYFNDDTYLIRDSQPSDFYKNGQPKLLAVYDALVPWPPFTNTYHNNVELIYRHFPNKKALKPSPWKFFNFRYGSLVLKNLLLLPWGPTRYVNQHLPVPMKKSTLAHLWEIEGETLDKTSRNPIRDYGVDVNQ